MLDVHLTIASNYIFPLQLPPFVTTLHQCSVPPPAVAPPFVPAIEAPATTLWPPGFATQQNKLTTTVTHKFQFIMLEGHDCGAALIHVTIPPTNILLPIIIMFSSRKAMFSASTVKANGTAMGCTALFPLPMPMMTCAEPITLPAGGSPMNMLNNVTAGMTLGDIAAGFAAIIIQVALDSLNFYMSENKIDHLLPLADIFENKFTRNLIGKLLGASSLSGFVFKTVANVLTGAIKIALTGEGTVKVTVGSAFAGVTLSHSTNLDGDSTNAVQFQDGIVSITGTSTTKADGTRVSKITATRSGLASKTTIERKTETDPSGKTTATETTTESHLDPDGNAAATTTTTKTESGKPPVTSGGSFGKPGQPIGFLPTGDPIPVASPTGAPILSPLGVSPFGGLL